MSNPTLDFDVTRDRNIFGKKVSMTFDLTPSDSVDAGGDSISASDLGLGHIEYFPPVILGDGGSNIRWAHYDYTNEKLIYFSAAGTEATGDLSSYSARITVEGSA